MKTSNKVWLPLFLSSIGVVLIFILFHKYYANSAYGSFGDSFGVLNTLFTGLAFAGVIASMWLQKKDLDDKYETQNKQLKHLELSQDLSLLTTYIQTKGGSETEEVKLAKKIIERLTLKLLTESKFLNDIRPKIDMTRSKLSTPQITRSKNYEFKVSLQTSLGSHTVKEISINPSPIDCSNLNYKSLSSNKPISIDFSASSADFTLKLTVEDNIAHNIWEYTFTHQDRKILKEVELVLDDK